MASQVVLAGVLACIQLHSSTQSTLPATRFHTLEDIHSKLWSLNSDQRVNAFRSIVQLFVDYLAQQKISDNIFNSSSNLDEILLKTIAWTRINLILDNSITRSDESNNEKVSTKDELKFSLSKLSQQMLDYLDSSYQVDSNEKDELLYKLLELLSLHVLRKANNDMFSESQDPGAESVAPATKVPPLDDRIKHVWILTRQNANKDDAENEEQLNEMDLKINDSVTTLRYLISQQLQQSSKQQHIQKSILDSYVQILDNERKNLIGVQSLNSEFAWPHGDLSELRRRRGSLQVAVNSYLAAWKWILQIFPLTEQVEILKQKMHEKVALDLQESLEKDDQNFIKENSEVFMASTLKNIVKISDFVQQNFDSSSILVPSQTISANSFKAEEEISLPVPKERISDRKQSSSIGDRLLNVTSNLSKKVSNLPPLPPTPVAPVRTKKHFNQSKHQQLSSTLSSSFSFASEAPAKKSSSRPKDTHHLDFCKNSEKESTKAKEKEKMESEQKNNISRFKESESHKKDDDNKTTKDSQDERVTSTSTTSTLSHSSTEPSMRSVTSRIKEFTHHTYDDNDGSVKETKEKVLHSDDATHSTIGRERISQRSAHKHSSSKTSSPKYHHQLPVSGKTVSIDETNEIHRESDLPPSSSPTTTFARKRTALSSSVASLSSFVPLPNSIIEESDAIGLSKKNITSETIQDSRQDILKSSQPPGPRVAKILADRAAKKAATTIIAEKETITSSEQKKGYETQDNFEEEQTIQYERLLPSSLTSISSNTERKEDGNILPNSRSAPYRSREEILRRKGNHNEKETFPSSTAPLSISNKPTIPIQSEFGDASVSLANMAPDNLTDEDLMAISRPDGFDETLMNVTVTDTTVNMK